MDAVSEGPDGQLASATGRPVPKEDDPDYRKPFLKTRLIVGIIGILLPPTVVFGYMIIVGEPRFKPSLSDYYYTPMRNWFVGSLWAIGAVCWSICGRSIGRIAWISFVAGLLAIAVALLPTSDIHTPTTATSTLHLVCAGILFALLGLMCFLFGRRDRTREDRTVSVAARVWARCTDLRLIVWGAVLGSVLLVKFGPPHSQAVLIGETVAVIAFAVSWFLKGSEIINIVREEHNKPPLLRAPAQS